MNSTTPKPFLYPSRFPLSRVKLNPPDTWPDDDLNHDGIMATITAALRPFRFARYHFHTNNDGTLTPLNRAYEWRIAVMIAAGRKTLRLG